jgi:type I restriction enzyme S subunit
MSEDAKLDDFVSGDQSNKQLDTEIEVKTSLDQTSVGNIPPGWSTARLQELTKNTLYGANESAEEYDPEKPRYIRIKDIDERGILKNEEKASL